VLDDVERASLTWMRLAEFLQSDPDQPSNSAEERRLERNLTWSVRAEQSLWERRLTELLADLIGFSTTNEQSYYRHYQAVRIRDDFRKGNADFKKYYGAESLNIADSIDRFTSSIGSCEARLDLARCWYLASQKPGAARRIAPFERRLDYALDFATKAERLSLGLSYDMAYGVPSRAIHATPGSMEHSIPWEALRTSSHRVILLSLPILLRIRRILRIRTRSGTTATLARLDRENRYPSELYDQLVRRPVVKGDFVVVHGKLCEVIGSRAGKFGYRSYQVRFLEQPPLPEIPEDWYAARYVRVYLRAKELREEVRDTLVAAGVPKPPPRVVARALRETVSRMWSHAGLKEYAEGRRDVALDKLVRYMDENVPPEEPGTT
jgi:hypothetical protein